MNIVFEIILVFIISATFGWLLEVAYRSYKHKHMVNPGFLFGPCLPIYGTGGVVLYLLCSIDLSFISNRAWQIVFLIVVATILMTAIEYIAGLISLKVFHNRLWDYSNRWGNIQGIICPLFSLIWGILCAVFYFGVYPWLNTLAVNASNNTVAILFMGIYVGIFFVDLCYSLDVMNNIRKYAIKIKESIDFEKFKHEIGSKFPNKKGHSLSGYSFNLYNRIKKFIEEKKPENKKIEESTENSTNAVESSAKTSK